MKKEYHESMKKRKHEIQILFRVFVVKSIGGNYVLSKLR
jgi:hypothetical protein